jgi:CRISPR-associated endonuclease/helicase Cas3
METLIFRYWGKAGREKSDQNEFHQLVYHCLDVAAVGAVLLKRNSRLRKQLADAVDLPEKIFCSWALFFLAVHDLGKFSEAFQGLRHDLYEKLQGKDVEKTYSVRHDSLGYLVWKDLARKKRTSESNDLNYLPKIFFQGALDAWVQAVMGHHGEPPNIVKGDSLLFIEHFFSESDLTAVKMFVQETADIFLPKSDLGKICFENRVSEKKITSASHWLAGLSVLCDWVGSNVDFFPFCSKERPLSEYWTSTLESAEKAVDACGILPEPRSPHRSVADLFRYIETPTPLQNFCHTCSLPTEPQLWILEDITGAGKTEAALILAHRLMDQNLGEGIFIGLPTMATANAMYDRMGDSYRNLFDSGAAPSLILSHSARHLSEKFRQSILNEQKETLEYAHNEADASAQCNAWLANHQKKALLADVGVGTVDQALLGILPVRHQSLRLFGLMNKVLILDEVHAYDSYTLELIKALLTFHSSIGGSAIVLTATLTQEMKTKLAQAFRRGVAPEDEDEFDILDFMASPDENAIDLQEDAYPLTTLITASDQMEYPVGVRDAVKRKVAVQMLHDDLEVYKLIKESAEQKQCVCWIRNTVSDAIDRITIENKVLSLFGNKSDPKERPGKILVATQVVEQSLDLDFDVMISDLAPMDLLIQRAGRLHRHIRRKDGSIKREEGATDERLSPVLYVLGPEAVEELKEEWFSSMFPKAAFVYPCVGQLWRTARLLKKNGGIRMPEDARALIEGVYDDQVGEDIPEALQDKTWEARGEEMAKGNVGQYNTLNWEKGYCANNRIWGDDARFPTRLGAETITVYLARYGEGVLSSWADGEYPWDLSSARVMVSNFSGLSKNVSRELKQGIECLQKNEKGLNKYSLILPLVQMNETEWGCDGVDGQERPVKVSYSVRLGLQMEKKE